MSKKSKNKQNQNKNPYKGYNQNQQENSSFDHEITSEKYENNSNAQA